MYRLLILVVILLSFQSCTTALSSRSSSADVWKLHPAIIEKKVRPLGRDTVWSTFLAVDTVGSNHHVVTIKGYELYKDGKHLAYLDYRFRPLHARFYIIPL